MGIFIKDTQALNEMYFGKTPDIIKLQDAISKVRHKQKYLVGGGNNAKAIAEIMHDKDLNKIASIIEEIWGFSSVGFTIYRGNPNAFTYPVTSSIDIKPEQMLVKGSNGYKYSKKSNFCAIISMAHSIFLDTEKFSDEEVMAVLLHEVGHSFDICNEDCIAMVKSARTGNIINLILSVIISMLNKGSGIGNSASSAFVSTNFGKRQIANSQKDDNANNSKFTKTLELISQYGNNCLEFIGTAVDVCIRATGINAILNFLSVPFTKLNNALARLFQTKKSDITTGRVKEYLADSFPMMYGYGAYQATALEKMCYETNSKSDEIINKIPLIEKLDAFSSYSLFVLCETFNTHPSLVARVNNMEKELEGELKKADIPPKMKKQIEDNLKDMKEFRKSVEDTTKITNKDPKRYRKVWLATLMKLDNDATRVSKYEKDYIDMESRDEYYDKLIKEQCKEEYSNLELIEFI